MSQKRKTVSGKERAGGGRVTHTVESTATEARFPPGTFFTGLTSIHWREAWKYGQRAYRYCQHDAGHAIGAISIAAAGLGWQARILDDLLRLAT